MQGMTRDTFHLHPVKDKTISFERKIGNDHLHIWLHFGDSPVRIVNDKGYRLCKVFDSTAMEWMWPSAIINEAFEIQPFSAVVLEKTS